MVDGFRLRVRFQKVGRLRYLSHLEVIRACERAVRRSRLPYAVSQGFTPRMRASFGPALPVGTAGEREYLDLLLTRFVPVDDALAALGHAGVPDLSSCQCGYVSLKEPSLAAALTIATYEVRVERRVPREEVEQAVRLLLDTGTLRVEHKGKPKVFDLSQALPKEPEIVSDADATTIRMAVRMGDAGSLRPDAFVRAALGSNNRTLVTRTGLFSEDAEGWREPL